MNAPAKPVSVFSLPFVTFLLKPKQILSQPAVLPDSCFPCSVSCCYAWGVSPAFWALAAASSQSFLGTNPRPLALVFGWDGIGTRNGAV